MSSKGVEEFERRAQRGERVAEIRAKLKLTGDEFAQRLAAEAKSYGLKTRYDGGKVSRMESGHRRLTDEEATIISLLDPEHRGTMWLVFGIRQAEKGRHAFKKLG